MARYINVDELILQTKERIKKANEYRRAIVDNELLEIINDSYFEEWKNAKNEKPEKNELVLTYSEKDGYLLLAWEGNCWSYGFLYSPKYWIRLPEPPETKGETE